MLVAGLWHGAAWTFIAFGAVHGVALAAERIAREARRRRGSATVPTSALRLALSRLLTFHVICLGWVFFRADSLGSALDILGRLGSGLAPSPAITALLVAVITGVLAVQLVPPRVHERLGLALAAAGPATTVAGCAVALVAIDVFGPEGVPPFLYFGF
jgi:hypothetical protein